MILIIFLRSKLRIVYIFDYLSTRLLVQVNLLSIAHPWKVKFLCMVKGLCPPTKLRMV